MSHGSFERAPRRLTLLAAAALALAACGGETGADASSASSAAAATAQATASALPTASAGGAPPPASSRTELGADPCAYDWIELEEAFRSCPALGDAESSWVPRVETRPAELKVASGGLLKFVVALGNQGKGSSWTAELDDHCGAALRPVLLDSESRKPLEDTSFWQLPSCPGERARVTLSPRGALTSLVVIRAARRVLEKVVVRHETSPTGDVVEVTETRQREIALPPGRYALELLLPTPHAQTVELPLEVTP